MASSNPIFFCKHVVFFPFHVLFGSESVFGFERFPSRLDKAQHRVTTDRRPSGELNTGVMFVRRLGRG